MANRQSRCYNVGHTLYSLGLVRPSAFLQNDNMIDAVSLESCRECINPARTIYLWCRSLSFLKEKICGYPKIHLQN